MIDVIFEIKFKEMIEEVKLYENYLIKFLNIKVLVYEISVDLSDMIFIVGIYINIYIEKLDMIDLE